MARQVREVGKIKAAKMVAAGEGVYRFKPVHPELNRDYHFPTLEGAEGKLDTFCAEYNLPRVDGTVETVVRTEGMVRDWIADPTGNCRMLQGMVKRVAYIAIRA